jgi:predicted nucleic acid-binding protein
VDCDYSDEIDIKSQELMKMNIRHKDALPIAAAIVSDVDFFITTDKRLLNKNTNQFLKSNLLMGTKK